VYPVEASEYSHGQGPHHAPHVDDGRHGPHPRSAQEEEDQEGTTLAERKDVAEEWRQEQSRKTRTPARVVTQA